MATTINPQIVAGTHVSIKNLVGAPQYNNMTGIAQSFESDAGRYNVALHKMKKNLGLKPEKLVVLCSKCAKKEHDTDCGCQRCDFPYCSETCRDADWDTAHKGKCDVSPRIHPSLRNLFYEQTRAMPFLKHPGIISNLRRRRAAMDDMPSKFN